MEIVYVYQKKRKEFGKQPLFRNKPAWQSVDIAPDPSYMENLTEKKFCSKECQCVPEQSEHEVNENKFMNIWNNKKKKKIKKKKKK